MYWLFSSHQLLLSNTAFRISSGTNTVRWNYQQTSFSGRSGICDAYTERATCSEKSTRALSDYEEKPKLFVFKEECPVLRTKASMFNYCLKCNTLHSISKLQSCKYGCMYLYIQKHIGQGYIRYVSFGWLAWFLWFLAIWIFRISQSPEEPRIFARAGSSKHLVL